MSTSRRQAKIPLHRIQRRLALGLCSGLSIFALACGDDADTSDKTTTHTSTTESATTSTPDSTASTASTDLSTIPTSWPTDDSSDETSATTSHEIKCLEEGELGYVKLLPRCCEGLVSTPADWQPKSDDSSSSSANGECYANEDFEGNFYCTQCGNGTCGPGEDYCNCPEDCT